MIRFEHIIKKYKQQDVINDLSFEIAASELVVLIGPSGCGKTTMLKMINRLITPTSGAIYIKGEDAAGLDKYELRRNIGYVIQSVGLFPHMTIGENIALVPSLQKKDKKTVAQKCAELMETVGLPPAEYRDRYPAQLSGGQQQRVGVARALAGDPEILLMDEPFSALDPITRARLQDELLSLQTRLQKTIVFVTHDMNEAVKLANKICIIEGGKILQYDTPANILKNPACDFVRDFIAAQMNDPGGAAEKTVKRPLFGFLSRVFKEVSHVFSALHHRK